MTIMCLYVLYRPDCEVCISLLSVSTRDRAPSFVIRSGSVFLWLSSLVAFFVNLAVFEPTTTAL